jgi:N-acetylglucosaminyldiphosphoundecaprenol N-acetyl-beta-D-mannosaminyltransferase
MRIRFKDEAFELKMIKGLNVVFNTESTFWYEHLLDYRRYVDSVDNIFIDGIGVALKTFGIRGFHKRYNGPDLLIHILDYAVKNDVKVFLLGGKDLSDKELNALKISSQIELPISSNIDTLVDIAFKRANEFKDGIVLISLGLPKQEVFALKLYNKLETDHCEAVIPIGAAIDFLTDHKVRAGTFWQLVGLEWFLRAIREPRMVKRLIQSFTGLIRFEISNLKK